MMISSPLNNMHDHLSIPDEQTTRFDELYARYRLLHEAPDACRPMIIIHTAVNGLPSWNERLADPLTMLRAELETLRPHLEIADDRVPSVRVQFGTGQVAAAFGCSIYEPKDNLPACGSHVLENAEDVYNMDLPALDSGWYGKLRAWTELWKENLPEWVHIQHPDIQSAFNSAHLIRGNDILTDFYDCPEDVEALLDKVTDFMLRITPALKRPISDDTGWFFDWGALWKGTARISNCSMQMISPEFYQKHVLPRDIRFLAGIGGGRMHYCGLSSAVMDDFLQIPHLTGLDFDATQHDFFSICERAPAQVAVMPSAPYSPESPEIQRLLAGDWPEKRNLVLNVSAPSVDEGRQLLDRLRAAMPY